jgi:hypothetical protein
MEKDIVKLFSAAGMAMICGVLNVVAFAGYMLATGHDIEASIVFSMVVFAPMAEEGMRAIAARMDRVFQFTIAICVLELMMNPVSPVSAAYRLLPTMMHFGAAAIHHRTHGRGWKITAAGIAAAVAVHAAYNLAIYCVSS